MAEPRTTRTAPDHPQIELRCRVDGSMLGLLREFVCTVARYLGFGDDQVAEIEICVDEACANVLEHAYKSQTSEPPQLPEMVVEITYTGEQMLVRVVDHGDGHQMNCATNLKSLQEYADDSRENYRGLGYLLMHKFMDRVDVQSKPGSGTTVELMKIRNK
jgi:anti-sigma regulatory factor (Ser/Thr protein kinase)